MVNEPRPIFVLGAPRSGTTMLGHYIGSHAKIFDCNELLILMHAFHTTPAGFSRYRCAWKSEYVSRVQELATTFISQKVSELKEAFFVDSTPFNLLYVDVLEKIWREPIYIL